jgi:hypothetical protein
MLISELANCDIIRYISGNYLYVLQLNGEVKIQGTNKLTLAGLYYAPETKAIKCSQLCKASPIRRTNVNSSEIAYLPDMVVEVPEIMPAFIPRENEDSVVIHSLTKDSLIKIYGNNTIKLETELKDPWSGKQSKYEVSIYGGFNIVDMYTRAMLILASYSSRLAKMSDWWDWSSLYKMDRCDIAVTYNGATENKPTLNPTLKDNWELWHNIDMIATENVRNMINIAIVSGEVKGGNIEKKPKVTMPSSGTHGTYTISNLERSLE